MAGHFQECAIAANTQEEVIAAYLLELATIDALVGETGSVEGMAYRGNGALIFFVAEPQGLDHRVVTLLQGGKVAFLMLIAIQLIVTFFVHD